MKSLRWILAPLSAALLAGACSSGSSTSAFTPDAGNGGFTNPDGGPGDPGYPSGDDGGAPKLGSGGEAGGGPGPGGTCNIKDPNADMDKDGWSPNQGDCNDCDPNVNPGAIDVLHPNDGGTPTWGDEDCSKTPGDSAQLCDQGLALTDLSPVDAAKSIELCAQASATDRKFGLLSAAYMRANGAATTPGAQVGIQAGYGANVHPQGGQNLLALSTGYARTVGQAGACNGISCQTNTTGTAPTGFPQDDPACPPTKVIADDVALEVTLRAPTNATGYAFAFKFYSFEFPDWVCDSHGYNDQFIALVTPPPAGAYVPPGSTGGNISFDGNKHPVSVNLGFFDVCDPSTPTRFATHCKTGGGACPALPSPYCPLGMGELSGTGFDTWHSGTGPAGATRWLQTQAPVKGGSQITIRFAIWDAGNAQFDSTVLIDNFQWIATGGTVAIGTTPEPAPK